MTTKEEEIFIRVGRYYYSATKYTTENRESIFLGGRSLERLVQDNEELVKETFKVEITKLDEFHHVVVTSNKTGEKDGELAYLFPKWTARKLRKRIIKGRNRKSYKNQYTI